MVGMKGKRREIVVEVFAASIDYYFRKAAHLLKEKIADSKISVIKNAGHMLHMNNPCEVNLQNLQIINHLNSIRKRGIFSNNHKCLILCLLCRYHHNTK